MQSPVDTSQTSGVVQGNSLPEQFGRHTPRSQTSPTSQRSPSCTSPLQSLSKLSHSSELVSIC